MSALRGDALSTLAYVANWRFIFTGQNYFVRFGPPSPLLHTWSLAVEEQFYLVWPALALFVLRRRGRRGLAVVAALGIVLSAFVTALLFHHGVSVTRLYYGTDTRVQEVMAGALLAVVIPRIARLGWTGAGSGGSAHDGGPGPEPAGGTDRDRGTASDRLVPRSRPGPPGWLISALGVTGAVAILWALHAVSGDGPFLYNGGFLLVAGATAAVILTVVVRPQAWLSRALSLGALGYIGRISYGLYLYHYPMFLMIDGQHTGLSGAGLLAVRLAATGAAAVVSYHLIEMPVRNRTALPGWHLVAALPVALALVVTALVLTTVPAGAPGGPVGPEEDRGVRGARGPAHGTGSRAPRPDPPSRGLAGPTPWAPAWGSRRARGGPRWSTRAIVGCDLDPSSIVNIEGSITQAAQGCADWPQTWQQRVDRLDPDVVAVLLGRWEVSDRIVGGTWTRIGEPAWDHLYASELGHAIRILSSRGAHVVVFTLPYITQTTEAPDGTPWDINQPTRTDQYNALVRRTVARYRPGGLGRRPQPNARPGRHLPRPRRRGPGTGRRR